MNIRFVWKGDPISQSDIESAERDISIELGKRFLDLISPSATVNLFNNIRKSVISGIVVNSGNQVIRITRLPYERNSTTYDPISDKKQHP